VNVKEIIFDPKIKREIELDTEITKELKEEGQLREIIRQIQELRKKEGLTPKDKIEIYYSSSGKLSEIITKNKKTILDKTRAKDIKKEIPQKVIIEKEIKIDKEKLHIAIEKLA